jgi:hypothetical protein
MRKPVPGYRYFECENVDCNTSWRYATRDCHSPSGEHCDSCGEFCHPETAEPHPEWETDENGNLLRVE